MDLGLVMLVLAGIGAVLTFVGRHVQRRRASQPLPALPTPTFKVVALGNSGSGKTVLLASLYSQFGVAPGRPSYLEAETSTTPARSSSS